MREIYRIKSLYIIHWIFTHLKDLSIRGNCWTSISIPEQRGAKSWQVTIASAARTLRKRGFFTWRRLLGCPSTAAQVPLTKLTVMQCNGEERRPRKVTCPSTSSIKINNRTGLIEVIWYIFSLNKILNSRIRSLWMKKIHFRRVLHSSNYYDLKWIS